MDSRGGTVQLVNLAVSRSAMHHGLRSLALMAIALATLLIPNRAEAYPQFQFSMNETETCASCHFSPAGSGLINPYGRYMAEEFVSPGGDGDLLHGLWEPPRIQLGGDIRIAAISNDSGGDERRNAVFPMQADLYARAELGAFSAYFATGACCGARDEGERQNKPSLYFAREYSLMWRPEQDGVYVRAGRFFAPFGLRLHDHSSFVRRDNGLYLAEETLTVSGGVVKNDWEIHVSAFGPDFQIDAREESFGGALLFEKRLERNGAWGAQAKLNIDERSSRATTGAIAKYWIPGAKLLFLAELDGIGESFDQGDSRLQMLGYLGASYFPVRGVMLGTALEFHDSDIAISDTERESVNFSVQVFPRAHFELHLQGRAQFASGGNHVFTGLFMAHYYL